MFAPATQPQQHQQPQQQKRKQSETVSSAEEEALKWNTDCVYFLASPLTCKKGPECEYRHSEYARMNPRDCYYWLNGNCMNPKCGFRHPPLEGLLGNQGGAHAGSVQPSHATAQNPGVAKQPVPCVFFQKGMCVKGDMCSFLHTPNPAAYKKQHPVEAKPATDPQISKKPAENNTGEKKFPDANFPKVVKARTDISAAPRVASAGLRDNRSVEGYAPKHAGYDPVVQRIGPTQLLQKYGSDDNSNFHNGKDADDLRESSPGFDVLVAGDTEYYHVEDRYGRRSQEGGNPEYDPDFSAIADGDREGFRDQREYRYAWGHRRVSSERGDRLDRRVYAEDERSENIQESDLRYRLAKQRKGNGMRSVGSHDYAAPESSMDRGYRDSRRDTHRENSISSSRLQGRIKLRERSNGEEGHFDRRSERGRDRSELSSHGRLRDRIKGRLEENHSGIQERGLRAPWARRRELEEERKLTPISIAETRSSKVESKPEQSLGKRKSLEEDHHSHKRSGDSFAAPLPFSEILKRKRAAASGGRSYKDETISKEEAGDETKLITEEKIEVVSEPNPPHEAEVEEGTVMEEEEVVGEEEVYEGNEEEQAYEGDELNGEYYYEEGYEEEGGEYAYEEGEEVVYAAEEGEEEATEGGEAEGEEDIEEKTVEMLS
ncbi:PREDICTED: zinc finger CCCH domain-containing protein 17-like [Camelina sativa]|uniref:Zinc finger CCCH domain-containing protein 17-like n=1 Tax=Camelina sativa TaxID=90675 RepID=A0ABM0ZCX0_CAMSA|nr:PREDICTED: zinc finger CCCH domain-containing protein 17-like [Camelina sativa]XP_010513986.1 PREDICTED: zinc finger CCCH domain-containing protein 17-like [Camelina sativa]XP_010513988.1 PREDICTED: zinc finger CCCH domain-containing protein 17-like [Camelina sativa]